MLGRFLSIQRMVRPDQLRGELPPSADAYRDLARIAVPSVIEMVFMSMTGAIDTAMVGGIGFEAIAAVGLTGQPRMLMLTLFFALNVGVTAIVARRKGQNQSAQASRTLRNALIVTMALTGVIMLATIPFSRPLLLFAGAQSDTIDMANTYFRILGWFLPINGLTMCINAAQRGVGNTKITMYVNIVANVVKIIFNFLLIDGHLGFPALGVAGAALASGVGFTVGLVLCLYSLLSPRHSEPFLQVKVRDDWRPHRETIQSIVRVGGNAMVEQAAMRVGFFAYSALVANLGTEAFAAHQIAMQFLNISFTFGDGIAVAGTSLVGQMLGRERPDMAIIFGKCSQRLTLIISMLLALIAITLRHQLVAIFIDPSDPVNLVPYQLAMELMFMVAIFQPVQSSSVVISGCLRGAGDNLYVAVIMILCVVVLRPALTVVSLFVLNIGLVGAWSSSLVDQVLRFVLMYRRFTGGKWQNIKV